MIFTAYSCAVFNDNKENQSCWSFSIQDGWLKKRLEPNSLWVAHSCTIYAVKFRMLVRPHVQETCCLTNLFESKNLGITWGILVRCVVLRVAMSHWLFPGPTSWDYWNQFIPPNLHKPQCHSLVDPSWWPSPIIISSGANISMMTKTALIDRSTCLDKSVM